MDTRLRSLMKAVSWRFWGTFISFVVTYYYTKTISLAFTVSMMEMVVKIGVFYCHERLWDMISIGKKHTGAKASETVS